MYLWGEMLDVSGGHEKEHLDPEIKIESGRLPPVEPEEAFRYLKAKMGP